MRSILFLAILSLLMWVSLASAVTFGWSPATDATGYKLSYGTQRGQYTQVVDVGAVTTAVVTGLTPGRRYYFSVQAYNAGGQSPYSSEVTWIVQPIGAPCAQ